MFLAARKLQEAVNRIGLGAAILRLPAPRMLSLPSPGSLQNRPHENYQSIISEPQIIDVSRDLFVSGFYSQAVEAVYKLLDAEVRRISEETLSGTKLMEKVFSPNSPIIPLNGMQTNSEKDEQSGYQRLFAGSMLGIRNPCAHEINWIEDPVHALEVIVLCQHLLKRVKAAEASKGKSQSAST